MTISLSRSLLLPFLRRSSGRALRRSSINWLTMNLVAVGLLAVTGFAYIALTTNVATQGFALKSLEQRVETLRDEHAQLTQTATERQSLGGLEAQAASLELTAVTQVEYVTTDNHFAAR